MSFDARKDLAIDSSMQKGVPRRERIARVELVRLQLCRASLPRERDDKIKYDRLPLVLRHAGHSARSSNRFRLAQCRGR